MTYRCGILLINNSANAMSIMLEFLKALGKNDFVFLLAINSAYTISTLSTHLTHTQI